MNQTLIKKIQKRIIQLLPIDRQNRPGLLLTDSCSEASRLVASWITELDKTKTIYVLQGTRVCGTNRVHDLLAIVTTTKEKVYVIDPTIWQFFPRAKSILVCTTNNIAIAIHKIKAMYGGQWSKNEQFIKLNKKEEKNYLNIISENISENLKQLKH